MWYKEQLHTAPAQSLQGWGMLKTQHGSQMMILPRSCVREALGRGNSGHNDPRQQDINLEVILVAPGWDMLAGPPWMNEMGTGQMDP